MSDPGVSNFVLPGSEKRGLPGKIALAAGGEVGWKERSRARFGS